MRRSSCHQTLPFIMALLAGTAAAQNITPGERQQAAKYLDDSRDGVVQAVQGLSDAQWKFTPGPTRWSIARRARARRRPLPPSNAVASRHEYAGVAQPLDSRR